MREVSAIPAGHGRVKSGVDVATAGDADCGPDAALLEDGSERVDRVPA